MHERKGVVLNMMKFISRQLFLLIMFALISLISASASKAETYYPANDDWDDVRWGYDEQPCGKYDDMPVTFNIENNNKEVVSAKLYVTVIYNFANPQPEPDPDPPKSSENRGLGSNSCSEEDIAAMGHVFSLRSAGHVREGYYLQNNKEVSIDIPVEQFACGEEGSRSYTHHFGYFQTNVANQCAYLYRPRLEVVFGDDCPAPEPPSPTSSPLTDIHLSDGSAFGWQRWGIDGTTDSSQKWLAGDFNGDGRADLADVFNDNGNTSIDVHLSDGSAFVAVQRWATGQGDFWDAQKWIAGDFNGDGLTDIAAVFNENGKISIDVHLSSGAGFGMQRWATDQGDFWDAQKWIAGDFNGDGRDDLANVFNDNGPASIDVHLSDGAGFGMQRWATGQGDFWDAQKWIAGDFNGDGRPDLANIFH
jgi:hypothetical protein